MASTVAACVCAQSYSDEDFEPPEEPGALRGWCWVACVCGPPLTPFTTASVLPPSDILL